MPSWQDFQPFIVTGLALGGVYSLSGVGMVVLYRATGVLNLATGAIGAMGALIAWALINDHGWPEGVSYLVCVLFGGVVTLAYGMAFGPPLAGRDPLVKAVATLGLALILLGLMSLIWSDKARSMILPTTKEAFVIGSVFVTWTQVIGVALGVAVTVATAAFLRYTKLGTGMRALADDREITASPRRASAARRGSGVAGDRDPVGRVGAAVEHLIGLDAATLTFLVISSVAAALIARLSSLYGTLAAALFIGLVQALATPILSISQYRDMAPFVIAVVALLFMSRKGNLATARGAR